MNEHNSLPNMRFKGFTDKWKQEKLGNIATVEMNKRIYKNQTNEKGEIPFYKIGTFGKKADSFISNKLFNEYKKRYSYPKVGDILISASGTIGNTIIYKGEDAYFQDSNIVWLNVNHKIILNSFLYNFYKIVHWKGLEGSTIKRLYNSNILSTSINYPSITEQQKIGDFFAELDKILDLQQQKINKFDLLKKSLLQKLFPKHDAKIPELRFKGFNDEWKEKNLSQIVKKITRKNSKLETSLPLTISADRGMINQNLFFNRQIASEDMSNYFLVKNGDFAYNKSYSRLAPFGTIKRLDKYDQGALSSLYIVFRPTKVDSNYLVSYFDSSCWYKQLSMISTEGVRNHGLLNVSSNDFFKMILSIPRENTEQQKIGNLLSKVDQLIRLENKKLHNLQQVKKCLLQNMFVE